MSDTGKYHKRLLRAGCLGAVVMLALPLSAQAADYRGQVSETISAGTAGVSPNLTLAATIDNGTGGPPPATGAVRFSIDARHLAANAWPILMAAAPGTQLGTVTTNLTGTDARQFRVLSHGSDSAGPYVRAAIGVPPSTSSIIGSDTIPAVLRQSTAGGPHITIAIDTHMLAGRLAAAQQDPALRTISLALRSSLAYQGANHRFTMNPVKDTALVNSLVVQACAQPACSSLRPSASASSASVHLPKLVTVTPPDQAMYGYRYSIMGTARPGDQVTLQGLSQDGLVAGHGSAAVRPNGTFIIRATLRSAFSDDGDLVLPARGRYAVASVEAGNATVYGIATQDTHVTLAQPRFALRRKAGNKLHFAIRVPGGDTHVRVAIKLGSKTLAKGFTNGSGRFFKTVVKPSDTGNLRVVAAVPGADTAISAATPLSR